MKGYRFYAEMPEARKSKSASKAFPFFPWTVNGIRNQIAMHGGCPDLVAIPLNNGRPIYQGSTLNFDAIAFAAGNLYPESCSTNVEYLRKRAVQIPETLARVLSPALFRYLES